MSRNYDDRIGEAVPSKVILVGGGLHNGLLALALLAKPDPPTVVVIEKEDKFGGNHTWCFHEGDTPLEKWVRPLVSHTWDGYDVHFPGFSRQMGGAYHHISANRFHEVLAGAIDAHAKASRMMNTEVVCVKDNQVHLSDDRVISGDIVIDARGPSQHSIRPRETGYQKFVGMEVELTTSCGLHRPCLMDARVPQTDGFRFLYVLPLSPTRVLIEDTYFSDGPCLDEEALQQEITAYASRQGWVFKSVARTECGVLPLPWSKPVVAKDHDSCIVGGYGGGMFHPITGYSIQVAMRFAAHMTQAKSAWAEEKAHFSRAITRQHSYLYPLNKVLFRHYEQSERWRLMARFYRCPQPVIERFYDLQLSIWDVMRILVGKIPNGMQMYPRKAV